jgi:alkylation response protein AidB-like acyl-CoA dehydrogenase
VDFKLSDEQLMIKDSVERFVAERASGADRWPAFAELGWLGIGAPEELGGFGGPLETLILMEAFGRGLVAEPYVTGVVLAGSLLGGGGRSELLARLIDGSERFAVAFEEDGAGYDPRIVETRVETTGSGLRLTGRKARAIVAPAPATVLVSARGGEGIALFAVPAGSAGVQRHDYVTEDGRNAATYEFAGVPLEPNARLGGLDLLERALDHANAALCAEALGVMGTLHDLTLAYLKERRQFGVPIGSFQALQHRMAEMFVELELARSMAYVAALTVASEPDAAQRTARISAAKVQIARSGRFIGQNAIQLHGAIAMADEYKAGAYFKRMTTLERLFGDVDYHIERYVKSR